MSTQLHPKLHRRNHHTVGTHTDAYFDAGHDPIASPEHPFQGDFVCNDKIVASDTNYAFKLHNTNTSLLVSSNNIAIDAIGDVIVSGTVSASNLQFNTQGFISSDCTNTKNGLEAYWIVNIDNQRYGVRLWQPTQKSEAVALNGSAPSFLQTAVLQGVGSVDVCTFIRGTHPLQIQWSKHLQIIPDQTKFTLHCATSGLYQCTATNAYGSTLGNLYVINTAPTTLSAVAPQTAKTLLTYNATVSLSGQTVSSTLGFTGEFVNDGAVQLTFQDNDIYELCVGDVCTTSSHTVVVRDIGKATIMPLATVINYTSSVRNVTRDTPRYDFTVILGNRAISSNSKLIYRNASYYTGNTVTLYDDNWLQFTTNVADLLVEN